MRTRSAGVLPMFGLVVIASGCPSTPDPTIDAAALDAGHDPLDVGADGASTDAPSAPDGASTDAPGAPDANAAAVLDAAVAMACEPVGGICLVAERCECPLSTPTPPEMLDECMSSARASCTSSVRASLASAFTVGGSVDDEAVAECIALLSLAFDRCLPPPTDVATLPFACTRAITLAIPLGGECDFAPYFCAGGEGWCGDTVCQPVPSTVGAVCDPVCGGGLACLGGHCATPSATGAWCAEHGDCADALCFGHVCGGPVAEGAPCTETEECATGALCTGGVCTRPLDPTCSTLDDPTTCGARSSCAPDLRHWCTPLETEGGPCTRDFQCIDELTCDSRATFPGTCGPRAELDEPCGPRRSCVHGLRCLTDVSVGASSCRPPLPLGASCADFLAPGGEMCEAGAACVEGVCAPIPMAGEPCSDPPFQLCAPGSFCHLDGGNDRCTPHRAIGERCFDEFECAEDAYCNTSFARGCQPRGRLGEVCYCAGPECGPCLRGLDCTPGADGTPICTAPPVAGEPCYELCAPETYCHVSVSGGLCRPSVCDVVRGG